MTILLVGVVVVVIAGLFAWSIRYSTGVIDHIATMFESPELSWGKWSGQRVLEASWKGMPVRISATHSNPAALTVLVPRPASMPELHAFTTNAGGMQFRSVRIGLIVIWPIAHASKEDLFGAGKEKVNVDITAYFTRARVERLGVLLSELRWGRFFKSRKGIGVVMSGERHLRWKPDEAREAILRTLAELQVLESLRG